MADQYSPEEINKITAEYEDSMRRTGKVSADLAERMKDASTGMKNYTYQLNQSIKGLGSSLKGLMGSVKDGAQGASAFNNSIESAADVVESFASKFGILGAIIGKLITAGAKYAVEVNKQSDALYKAYQDLNKVGAATAGGMTDVYKQMQQFGYGIEQLGEFTNLIKQNSTTLANFGGTVSRGAKIFAGAAQDVQKSELGKQLQLLGKTPDEINKGIAGFIQNQNVLGRGQNSIQQDLKKQTKDYLLNLDLLSRLTGQDAETIQRKQQEALAVDQYNATQFMLKKRMDAGDEKAAAQYKANERIASTLTGEALKDFVAGVGGDQEAMGRIYQTSSGAAQMMNEGITDASAFLQTLSKDAGKMQDLIAPAAALGVNFRDMTYGMKDLGELTAKTADETVQQQTARAKAEQELAMKGLDPATKAATELRISQQQQRDASQNLINAGIVPVTKAMEKLAGVTNAVAQVPGAVAPGIAGGPAGGGQQGGAKSGGLGGFIRNALGIGGGGAAPSGEALTGKSMDGINPNLASALSQAAGEYKQITGQNVEVTSALRDSTKQAELYNDYVSGKSKFPAAPPGKSLHEQGLAVDVNRATADKLDSLGLLSKYGLSRPVAGDPVHIQGAYANGGYLSANGIGVVGENGPEIVKGPADVTSAQNSASMFSALEQMPDLMAAQLDKLSELVRVMENQSSISSKILQHTQ